MEHPDIEQTAFFVDVVEAIYDIEPCHLVALPESDPRTGPAAFRLDADSGPVAILRAWSEHFQPPEDFRYFYPWVCNGPDCDIVTWLATRVAALTWLAQSRYPAPRPLRTRSGTYIGAWDGWHVVATSFVEGSALRPTLDQLRLLGELVGRLHALPLETPASGPRPGPSYWHPDFAVPSASHAFALVANVLPDDWRHLYDGMCSAVASIERRMRSGDLIETVIHGDTWAANALHTAAGEVALIDWDQGGLGPAVLDLARLLLECHLDADLPPDEPLAWHVRPDPARIAAVVDGYARARMPSPTELDALLDALRFGTAFIGALHFEQALLRPRGDAGWRQGMQRRFERLQNRFEISETVGAIAGNRFRERLS